MSAIPSITGEEQVHNKNIIECINALATGNYTIEINGNDELSTALRGLSEKLRDSAGKEMSRVVQISVQANETAIFSAQMLSNLRKVDHQAQTIAAAAEEMVATVKSIGMYGKNISAQAAEAEGAVRLGTSAAEHAVEKMNHITASVNDTVAKVNFLAQFSEKIGKISGDIKKIADQTNLLALNATIEAARAGEAGRGFAVVAGEVKSLATQTRSSTEEINGIISQLQLEVRNVLSSMQESSSAVADGRWAISEVGKQIEEIKHKIDEVSSNTANIASTLSEQAQASQEVAKGIASIATSSSESVQGIEKIVDAMNSVEKMISQQIAKLAELNVPDKVIKLAQSDHVLWKKRLANMIIGREGLKAEELADHHSCRLGKWYDAVSDMKYKNNPIFQKLVEPHKLVHAHGIQSVRYFNDGKLDEALKEIGKVEAASKDVLRMLAELEEN